jgi:hypothetical protein
VLTSWSSSFLYVFRRKDKSDVLVAWRPWADHATGTSSYPPSVIQSQQGPKMSKTVLVAIRCDFEAYRRRMGWVHGPSASAWPAIFNRQISRMQDLGEEEQTRTESSDPGSTSSWPSLRTISEDSPTAMLAVMAARRTSLNITANPTARFVRPAKMDQANAELLKRLFVQTVLPVVCNTHRYFQMLSARSRQRNFHPREDFIELYAL